MLVIVDAFIKIALRRLGPEHLPSSSFLLLLSGAAYAFMQAAIAAPTYGFSLVLLRSLVLDLALLVSCVWALLQIIGRPARLQQTLTALLGTGALLSALLIPVIYWWQFMADQQSARPVTMALVVAVVIWTLVVNGHILSRALSAPYAVGIVIAIIYFLLNSVLLEQVVPAPT